MNDQDPGTAPAPQLSARLESAFELAARELLRERRSERRWRVFFRLVWLGLVLAVAWALLSQRMSMTAPAGPQQLRPAVRAVLKLLDSFGNALLGGGGDVHFIPAAVGNDGSGGEGTLRQRSDIFEGGHGQAPFGGSFF